MKQIALDTRVTRHFSVGMQRYNAELSHWLPQVAPDLELRFFARGSAFSFAEQVELPLAMLRSRAAFVHHLSLYAPLCPSLPVIVTIHDLIHLRYPEQFKPQVQAYYRWVVGPLSRRALRIITDDEKTVDDVMRFLGVAERKIRVIPLGVSSTFLAPEFAPNPCPVSRPYLLYAGNRRPHKDLATAFAAWASLPDEIEDDFWLTGSDDVSLSLPRTRPNGARVCFLGELSDEQLARTLHQARALVYPSHCEGFGLPLLEALSVGTPVIASSAALPGILRGYAISCPPGDIMAFRHAIIDLPQSDFQERTARRAYSASFTWERCARATADLYREVLEEMCASSG